ncbi:MAG: ABC transporter permease [Bacteroidales bacterium]|nr:ABC transporter permease [Bacteroidales bacterium]
MKSYLRFLGRNKLYTAIEVIGLSVALAFVLILSSYIIEETGTDREVKGKGRLWVCHNKGIASSSQKFDKIFRAMPEVTDFCQFSVIETPLHIKENDLSYSVKPMYVSGNFFEFMGYELVAGDASKLWTDQKSVVISERFARNLYPREHAVGQTLTFADNDDDEEPFWNTLTITGVYRNPEKSIVMNSDIIMNIDCWPYKDVPGVDMGAANLLRLARGTDREELCERLYKEAADNGMVLYEAGLPEPLMLTSFSNMDINVAKIETAPFINLTDRNMMKMFFIVCVILLGFAVLNHISLTIAFSRFRSKEMATRRIMGTTRGSLTIRSFFESFCLTAAAFALGITTAYIIQEKASAILETEISIFSNPAEIIWSVILIIVLSTVTGLAPAFISSQGKPINIIKGEERYKDKQILGKAFIFIQAAISIVCLSTAMACWLQTRKMLETPLGYRTGNILSIKGIPTRLPAGLEEIPCVRRVGKTALVPIDGAIMKTSQELADERLTFNVTMCDSTTLSILGIEIIEMFKGERGVSDTYVTESSAQWMRNLCSAKDLSEDRIKDVCDGVVSEMRFGNHSGTTEGITAIIVQENKRLPNYIVEVEGDVREAERIIKEHLNNIDVREHFDGYNVYFKPEIKTLDELVEESYHKEKNSITLIGIFALLCMLMTAMAIIALSSHFAQLNRHDTAVRKVFGISRNDVFWNTVLGFTIPVLAGAAVAIPAAVIYIGRWLEGYPVRIANSPLIYVSTLIIILLVTLASVSLQAIRLMRTNPAEALKKE